jgi:hypothetical protein
MNHLCSAIPVTPWRPKGLRRRGLHTLLTIGSQMAVRLSALGAGHPLLPERFLVLIYNTAIRTNNDKQLALSKQAITHHASGRRF